MLRFTLGLGVFFFLLFPFFALFFFSSNWRLPLTPEVGEVFLFTCWQAVLSAFFSLVFGLLGGLGLLWLEARVSSGKVRLAEAFALLPNVAPVLVLLLATIKYFPFARGLIGIVFVHALLNIGLVSVAFTRLVRMKMGGLAELAWIEGASGWRFFWRGVLPVLKFDLALLFLFVFALCFSSFAVPLMIGGSRATTLEVLIYEKIRISGDWSAALGIATLQMVATLFLSWVLRREPAPVSGVSRGLTPLLSWAPGVMVVGAAPLILFLGLVDDVVVGAERVFALSALRSELPILFLSSMAVAVGTGLMSAVFLLIVAFVEPRGAARKFLIGYVAPSSVLMGFALLVAIRGTGAWTYLKMTLGITLITVPSFYRLYWDSLLQSLESQRWLAWSLGANRGLIFREIVLPQVIRSCCFIAGLASLWAWGDFALSSVVAERTMTIAMLISGLMGSYRLDAATFLVWVLLLGGAMTFAIFNGVGRVLGTKSQT